jgi:hypothetical protein
MVAANTLAYYDTAIITAIIFFIVQTSVDLNWSRHLLKLVNSVEKKPFDTVGSNYDQ